MTDDYTLLRVYGDLWSHISALSDDRLHDGRRAVLLDIAQEARIVARRAVVSLTQCAPASWPVTPWIEDYALWCKRVADLDVVGSRLGGRRLADYALWCKRVADLEVGT